MNLYDYLTKKADKKPSEYLKMYLSSCPDWLKPHFHDFENDLYLLISDIEVDTDKNIYQIGAYMKRCVQSVVYDYVRKMLLPVYLPKSQIKHINEYSSVNLDECADCIQFIISFQFEDDQPESESSDSTTTLLDELLEKIDKKKRYILESILDEIPRFAIAENLNVTEKRVRQQVADITKIVEEIKQQQCHD